MRRRKPLLREEGLAPILTWRGVSAFAPKQGHLMAHSFTGKKRIRKSFGRIPEAVTMPNLIEVQRSSYEQFLQRETRQPSLARL